MLSREELTATRCRAKYRCAHVRLVERARGNVTEHKAEWKASSGRQECDGEQVVREPKFLRSTPSSTPNSWITSSPSFHPFSTFLSLQKRRLDLIYNILSISNILRLGGFAWDFEGNSSASSFAPCKTLLLNFSLSPHSSPNNMFQGPNGSHKALWNHLWGQVKAATISAHDRLSQASAQRHQREPESQLHFPSSQLKYREGLKSIDDRGQEAAEQSREESSPLGKKIPAVLISAMIHLVAEKIPLLGWRQVHH